MCIKKPRTFLPGLATKTSKVADVRLIFYFNDYFIVFFFNFKVIRH